jgi:hypothetical protein
MWSILFFGFVYDSDLEAMKQLLVAVSTLIELFSS